jgi:hypothetical protein
LAIKCPNALVSIENCGSLPDLEPQKTAKLFTFIKQLYNQQITSIIFITLEKIYSLTI